MRKYSPSTMSKFVARSKDKQLRILFFALLGAILLHMIAGAKFRAVDIQDELVYMDHFIKASNFDLGQQGDRYSIETLNEVCNRNGQLDHPRVPVDYRPKCADQNRVAAFGTNFTTPLPLYFVVTGIASRAITVLGGFLGAEISIVTVGRALGAIWFALGILICRRAARYFTSDLRNLAPVTLGVASLQSIMHQQSIINASSMSLLMGSSLVLATVRFLKRNLRGGELLSTTIIVGLTSNQHQVVVVAMMLFCYLYRGSSELSQLKVTDQKIGKRYLGCGILLLGTFLSTQLWPNLIRGPLRFLYGDPDTDPTAIQESLRQQWASRGFHWYEMFSAENMIHFLVPHNDAFQPAQRFGGPYQSAAYFVAFLLGGSLVASLISDKELNDRRSLALSHFIAAVSMPVILVLYRNLGGLHDLTAPRFALSLVPLLIICSLHAIGKSIVPQSLVWTVCAAAFVVAMLTNFVVFV